MLPLSQLEQGDRLFILIAQSLGADHLGAGQSRPLLPADGTERQVCHPRHRGQRQRDMDLDSSDFNHGDLLEIKHTEWRRTALTAVYSTISATG